MKNLFPEMTMTPRLWFLTVLGLVGIVLLNVQIWVHSWHNWLGVLGAVSFGWALGSLLMIWHLGRVHVIDAVRARELRELEVRYPLRTAQYFIEEHGTPFIKCLVCGMTSYNRHDIEHRYCANCHRFFEMRERS